jgi:hypothetical protein
VRSTSDFWRASPGRSSRLACSELRSPVPIVAILARWLRGLRRATHSRTRHRSAVACPVYPVQLLPRARLLAWAQLAPASLAITTIPYKRLQTDCIWLATLIRRSPANPGLATDSQDRLKIVVSSVRFRVSPFRLCLLGLSCANCPSVPRERRVASIAELALKSPDRQGQSRPENVRPVYSARSLLSWPLSGPRRASSRASPSLTLRGSRSRMRYSARWAGGT